MQESDRGRRWLTAAASSAVGAAFYSLWFWLLPNWLGFQLDAASSARWRWFGALPAVLGFSVSFRCMWDFGWTGRGTPAPIAPPRNLVVIGLYRYVRNPMYVGFFTGWAGLWLLFGRANLYRLVSAGLVIGCVLLFVRYYEEPALRAAFGEDYTVYRRNVRAWIPRLRAWQQPARAPSP